MKVHSPQPSSFSHISTLRASSLSASPSPQPTSQYNITPQQPKSSFVIDAVQPDAIFALMAKCKADTFKQKVDLGVGAYRDNSGHPWVLPVVKKVDEIISSDPSLNHEYLPIAGLPAFTSASAKVILGNNSPALVEDRVASIQTISGTGANHLGSLFLKHFPASPNAAGTIYISNPTWANHATIFKNVGLNVKQYPYWNPETLSLDFDGLIGTLSSANRGDIVLLHACAHNPTGIDPTKEQWAQIADVCDERGLYPFFDCAYQGFASGNLNNDAWAVRYFVNRGLELLVCQSFAKNFGLYGQRVGALHVVFADSATKKAAATQLELLQRAEISNPPAYGARIVSRILTNAELFSEWERDLLTMANRINDMRIALRKHLEQLGTPGTWDHITSQIGMFSFTGLQSYQVERLVEEFHVYLSKNGRISMAGLNESNVEYVAKSIDAVVRGI
ncbi:hypothetical protein DV451_002634 [Geotrichum candidum]|uniref:Aspartate aminotransferase n=1 Tax=Geotrichum candidum TaxID=1173061 RepID=A0A9P5KUA9_GEOCN|nr:hypothetical protein DV451_002634 [Geotrichum candidum]KAF5107430.1 hypothetical protein DV453_003085 [Geotrichum candidum]